MFDIGTMCKQKNVTCYLYIFGHIDCFIIVTHQFKNPRDFVRRFFLSMYVIPTKKKHNYTTSYDHHEAIANHYLYTVTVI